jgi:hypothetical protein
MGANLTNDVLIRESATSFLFPGVSSPTIRGSNLYGNFRLGSARNFDLYGIDSASTNLNFIANAKGFQIKTSLLEDQTVFTTYDTSGNHIVIGNTVDKDYDHPTQTDPTFFIHSDTNPDTDNTEWLSLAHNKTDAVVQVGHGQFKTDCGRKVKITNFDSSSAYTINDNDEVLFCHINGNNNITLPSISGTEGRILSFVVSQYTSGTVLIVTPSTEKIRGNYLGTAYDVDNFDLSSLGLNEMITLISNGTNWYLK